MIDKDVLTLFTDSESNTRVRQLISDWEGGEEENSDSGEGAATSDSHSVSIEVYVPYNSNARPSASTVKFSSKLNLFGSDDGTGVLFLEDTEPLKKVASSNIAQDTVELVSFLGQAQQNIRRIGTRLNVLTPTEI